MADHPFKGKWNSYGLNDAEETFNDGEMVFDILENGTFNRGGHKPRLGGGGLGDEVILEQVTAVTLTEIHIKEKTSQRATYHGFLLKDPFQGNRKVIIGTYTIPRVRAFDSPLGSEGRRPSDEDLTQINGTWVATQP